MKGRIMIYSLTDKLSFEENPIIELKGKHLEVNADAETLLEVMSLVKGEENIESMKKAYEILFSDEDRKKIADMKLLFKDWLDLITVAMALVQGEDPDAALKEDAVDSEPSLL